MDRKTYRSVMKGWSDVQEKKKLSKKQKKEMDVDNDNDIDSKDLEQLRTDDVKEDTELDEAGVKVMKPLKGVVKKSVYLGPDKKKEDDEAKTRQQYNQQRQGTYRKEDASIASAYRTVKESERAQHYKGATKPAGRFDTLAQKNKEFVDSHINNTKKDETEKKGHEDVSAAGRGGPSQASSRGGTDQLTNGDKKVVNPVDDITQKSGGPKVAVESVKQDDETMGEAKVVYNKDGSFRYEGDWKKSERVVKDKSGAKHDPMSRTQHLARLGLRKVADKKKVKTEQSKPWEPQAHDVFGPGGRTAHIKQMDAIRKKLDKEKSKKKVKKESVEQVDEISSEFAQRYHDAAGKDLAKRRKSLKRADKISKSKFVPKKIKQAVTKNADKHYAKMADRYIGRRDARNRIPDPKLSSEQKIHEVSGIKPEPKGRPRGAAHIENVRFWDLPDDSLKYIIKDAGLAMKANPQGKKAGKYADEVNDATTVLYYRKKKNIKVKESADQIDELKKSTLASYIKKASRSSKAKAVQGLHYYDKYPKLAKGLKNISDKRLKNIDLAVDKLAK